MPVIAENGVHPDNGRSYDSSLGDRGASSVHVNSSDVNFSSLDPQNEERRRSEKMEGMPDGFPRFADPQQAFMSLSQGLHPEALELMGKKMGVSPLRLQETIKAINSGNVQGVDPEILHKALNQNSMPNELRNDRNMISEHEHPMPDVATAASLVTPSGFKIHNHPSLGSVSDAMTGRFDNSDSILGFVDDEQSQDWLYLYRGTFLRHADAMYGGILMTLVVLLFSTGTLSFLTALWLVPLCMILGVRVILVGAAGIPSPMLPYTRLPAGIVLACEIAAISTFIASMMNLLRDKWLESFIMLSMTGIALFFKLKSYLMDPGTIPPADPRPPPLPPYQAAAMQAANPHHCFTCGIYRPIRSKHCAVCNRCVSCFDHHCPVIANCIGEANRRYFTGYLMCLFVAEIIWLRLAIVYWKRILYISVS